VVASSAKRRGIGEKRNRARNQSPYLSLTARGDEFQWASKGVVHRWGGSRPYGASLYGKA
jgi:hypothetical protein